MMVSSYALAGQGEPGVNGGPSGDLYIVFRVKSDPRFERDGDDIYHELPLTFAQAALGDEIEVPTVQGKVKLENSSWNSITKRISV